MHGARHVRLCGSLHLVPPLQVSPQPSLVLETGHSSVERIQRLSKEGPRDAPGARACALPEKTEVPPRNRQSQDSLRNSPSLKPSSDTPHAFPTNTPSVIETFDHAHHRLGFQRSARIDRMGFNNLSALHHSSILFSDVCTAAGSTLPRCEWTMRLLFHGLRRVCVMKMARPTQIVIITARTPLR